MDKHVYQVVNWSIFDRIGLWLLRVAIMRSKPDFRRIIQAKVLGNSIHNIVIGVILCSVD